MVESMIAMLNDVLLNNRRILSTKQLYDLYDKILKSYKVANIMFEVFCEYLSSIGIDMEDSDSQRLAMALFKLGDANGDGYIDGDEFVTLGQYLMVQSLQAADSLFFDDIFRIIDVDDSGTINVQRMTQFVQGIRLIAITCQDDEFDGTHSTIDEEMLVETLFEAFGHGEVSYEQWVLAVIESDIFYALKLDPSKIEMKNEDFQILFKQEGLHAYEANKVFMEIDIDHGGSLDTEEIVSYKEFLELGTSLRHKSVELAILGIQMAFIVFMIIRMYFAKQEWWGLAVDALDFGTTLGGMYLFTSLVFEQRFRNRKILRVLEAILTCTQRMHSDHIDEEIVEILPLDLI